MFQTISDKTKTKIVIGITVISFALFAFIFTRAALYNPDSSIEVPQKVSSVKTSSVPGEYPLKLQIPKLQIDAAVQYVGVAKSGKMAVPNNYTDVGWYRGGTLPGDIGSAVIDGHVDNGFALPGVFKHLNDIQIGDDIYVLSKQGEKLHFVVRDIESYPYTDVPTDLLFNRNDGAWLNLITCEGGWVSDDKTYDHRLAVFAELVP